MFLSREHNVQIKTSQLLFASNWEQKYLFSSKGKKLWTHEGKNELNINVTNLIQSTGVSYTQECFPKQHYQ